MYRGYVALHRKIVDWEWYSDANVVRLFIHLLLTANWEPKKWRGHIINRGQKATSLGNLAKELNLSVKQIRLALNKLKRTNEIATKGASSFTLITVINYDLYQDPEKTRASKRASNGADEGQTKGKQRATTKPLETLEPLKPLDNNTSKNHFDDAFEKFWSIYPKKVEKKSAHKKFVGIIKRGEATEDQIIDGVKSYLKSDTVLRGFIKNPTTWLNGGCWGDEHQKQKEGQGKSSFDVMRLLKEK